MNRTRAAAHPDHGLTAKPGAWGELALTLPVFLTYQFGVVFLHVRNASDVVSGRLLDFAHGDRLTYFALTAALATAMIAIFALLGRGHALRPGKLVQIALEGATYAVAMGVASSWLVGKLFARVSPVAAEGPFAGFVMSLGAGFYEEIAFRVALFGLGAKLLVWLVARQRLALVGSSPALGPKAFLVVAAWALVCAFGFSLVHYLGPLGDAFDARSFVARVVLGLALTLIYGARGFAAAVWTHALYDIWVLVL
ncbi:MAG: CPBP family glutamic-type intramembrane protease [Myxococcota bacterium]|nr:CPBP family glutamic-type intramembrane protease [Myxococcota bacterium]